MVPLILKGGFLIFQGQTSDSSEYAEHSHKTKLSGLTTLFSPFSLWSEWPLEWVPCTSDTQDQSSSARKPFARCSPFSTAHSLGSPITGSPAALYLPNISNHHITSISTTTGNLNCIFKILIWLFFTSLWDEYNCAVVWTFFGIAFLWDWNENWTFPVLWSLLSFPNFLAYWVQHFHSIQNHCRWWLQPWN